MPANPTPLLPALPALDAAARAAAPLAVRWSLLMAGLPSAAINAVADRWRVPNELRELALLLERQGDALDVAPADAESAMNLLQAVDALRRPERLAAALQARTLQAAARGGSDAQPPAHAPLLRALAAVQAVDTAALAQQAGRRGVRGPALGEEIRAARVAAIAAGFRAADRSTPSAG